MGGENNVGGSHHTEGGVTVLATSQKDLVKVEHKNIYSALSGFQGDMKPIEKSSKVSFKTKAGELVEFDYAPLEATMEFIYPFLAKHGLSVRHEISEKFIECILTHETTELKNLGNKVREIFPAGNEGEREVITVPYTELSNELRSGKLPVDLTKSDMKDVGGQITYGRRYTLGLVLGLSTEEDKDTEIMDASRKKLESFAYTRAKEAVEKAEGEDLDKQIQFLEGEMKTAEDVEAGKSKKVPSLGLKASQYKEILEFAKNKKVGNINLNDEKENG